MQLTTENIIKILPFSEEFKNDLLTNWDTLPEDQQYTITQIVWDAYAAVYEIQYDTNLQAALLRVKEGKEHMDAEFGKRVMDQTEKDMKEEFSSTVSESNLAETREALQEILNKIPQNSN